MITTAENNTVTREGVSSESTFRIKAGRKAFQVLSSGLYSDKKMAIVREILINGQDAHICAHNHVPVLVHLPNNFEPWLSFRDFGTGLSHSSVMTVYTTYFESTKTESNDLTGCLGLGSKSPFSYVDNFTVISYFDGMKRTYNAFINEDAMPSIALLSEEATTESNGLEVVIPVKESDFEDFRDRLETIVQRFQIKPTVTGNDEYAPKSVEYKLTGTGWGLRKEYGTAVAVMGSIGYPIDLRDASLEPKHVKLLDTALDIEFPLGALDIAASREKLSFDVATISNIKTYLDVILLEIKDLLNQKFVDCKTLWEARCLAWDIFHGEYRSFAEIIKDDLSIIWNGQTVDYGNIHIEPPVSATLFHKSHKFSRRKSRPIDKEMDVQEIESIKTNRFMINDLPRGSETRIKNLIRDEYDRGNQNVCVYLLECAATTFADALGMDVNIITRTSELPKPYNPRYSSGSAYQRVTDRANVEGKAKARVLRYVKSTTRFNSDNWIPESIDISQGGVYVPILRYKINGYEVRSYIENIKDEMRDAGIDIDNIEIYGIKESHVNKLELRGKLSNWITLRNFCNGKISDYIVQNNVEQRLADIAELNKFDSECSFTKDSLTILSNGVKSHTKPFGAFTVDYLNLDASVGARDTWDEIKGLTDRYGHTLTTLNPSYPLTSKWKEIVELYPMFSIMETSGCINSGIEGSFAPIITDYINSIDKTL